MTYKKKVTHFIEHVFVLVIRGLFYLLPLIPAHWLGAMLGLVGYALGICRKTTHHNLKLAFGKSLSKVQRLRVALKAYAHFGGIAGEIMVMGTRGFPFSKAAPRVSVSNPEIMEKAAEKGKGVILVTGHYGNWMWIPTALKQMGLINHMYSGPISNPIAYQLFTNALDCMGAMVMEKRENRGTMRQMLRALKSGHVMGMATDQHFSRKEHFVQFFGESCSASPGTALLAISSGVPLIFAECLKVGSCRYEITFTQLVVPAPPEDDRQLYILQITQQVYQQLEKCVRLHPEQYFWMHNIWREQGKRLPLTKTNEHFLEKIRSK